MTRRLAHKLESQWRSQDVLQSEEKATFDEFLLSQRVLSGLRKAGFIRPSPIQLRAIPLGLCGFDMVVQAKSGTGKTCVFSVLALQAINTARNAVQVLILAPTREIAVQSCDTVRCLGCDTPGLEVYAFIGGLSVREDVRKLARCHVAVGTLGRLLQLVEQGQLCLDGVRLLVLDEADQLLGESFREGLRQLWVKLPARFQIVATSATYPPEVARTLEQELLHDPVVVRLGDGTPSLLGVSQWYCVAEGADEAAWFPRKVRALECVLRRLPFSQCLVFLNSQARAQSLAERLTHAGFAAQLLSGAQDQEQRIRALVQLKAFRCRILVSTDLGARGIDAERVNLVVHFDVARDLETHLHRTGRAGRYGTAGQAVTLVTGRTELKQLRELCSSLDLQIKPLPGFPSLDDGSSECWVNGGVEAKRISKEMCTQAMESSLDMVGMPRTEDAGPSEGGVLQLTGIESSHLEPGLNESNLLEPAMTESSQLQPVTTESTALKQVIAESDLLQSAHIESDELCLATTETHCLQQTMTEGALLQPLMSERAQVQPTMTERDCLQPNGVESGLLRPTMGPLLTFEEALRGKRAGPPVRPILPWPPNPSLGQDLAVRIAEEKEAFCRTYNITLKPGRIMGLATRLSSDGSCKLHSCSEAGTQNLHGKTEVGEDGCALQSYPDQSKRQERQLGGIVAEEAGEANVVLKQSTNARQCTLQTQQETSGFALASEVMGTKRAGIKELPKASTPPLQVRSINLESESAVLREAQGKENVFKSSSGERTGNLGWTQAMENKGHVGNRSLREQGSMFSESQLDEKEKGKSKSSDRCSLQLKPNIAAAELRPGKMRWRKNVSYQDQQRLKSTSSEEADGEDNVVACARWSRRLEQQPPSRKPACSPRSSAPPVMPHLSLTGGDSNLPQTHPATEEGLCFECAQKCDNIRAACYSGRHLKRTVMADTWFPSWTHLQPNAATALMDWSRNWFRWHQWYIRKMLETSGRY